MPKSDVDFLVKAAHARTLGGFTKFVKLNKIVDCGQILLHESYNPQFTMADSGKLLAVL